MMNDAYPLHSNGTKKLKKNLGPETFMTPSWGGDEIYCTRTSGRSAPLVQVPVPLSV